MTDQDTFCPNCERAAELIRETRLLPLGHRRVEVDDEFLRCGKCGEEFYTPELADQRHRRAVDRARLEDNLLSPAQIRAIREKLGLSQRLFEHLLGVGEKTCVRWEQGRVCQNVATDRLIRLIAADRKNVAHLASINGVVLPDQCFVPEPAESLATPAWSQANASVANFVLGVLSGSDEGGVLDTAEHQAIRMSAKGFVPPVAEIRPGGRQMSLPAGPHQSLQ